MKQDRRRWLVPVTLVVTIAFNGVAQWLPLNGRTTGEISDTFAVFITPAGYVFGIWSVIYLGLVAYAAYQWGAAGRLTRMRALVAPFMISCVANVSWLALWHYGHVGASLGAMLTLCGAIAVLYLRLQREPPTSSMERWCVDHPFSIYFGWVTVATLVNLSVVLEAYDARPFAMTAPAWAIAMLGAALLSAAFVAVRHADRWYLAVIVWATIGTAVAPEQAAAVAISAVAVAAGSIVLIWLAPRLRRPTIAPSAAVHARARR